MTFDRAGSIAMSLRTLFASANLDINTCGFRSWTNCPLRKLANSAGFNYNPNHLLGDDVGDQVFAFLNNMFSIDKVEAKVFLSAWDEQHIYHIDKLESLEIALTQTEECMCPPKKFRAKAHVLGTV